MKVHAYVMAWREAETIALTIKHYQQFCDKVILLDNFSDDNTREIAEQMGAEVRLFGIKGVLDDREYTKIKNNVWKESDADWVIVVDADEILWDGEPDINSYLINFLLFDAKEKGYTIIKPQGWQVVSRDMPKENWLEITNGFAYDQYSKLCCFRPKEIQEINYVHGCHVANPKGKVNILETGVLFHYRNVGGPERLVKRHALYRERMSEWNKRWNAGGHYLYEDQQRRKEWEEQFNGSRPFASLGTGLSLPDTQSPKND